MLKDEVSTLRNQDDEWIKRAEEAEAKLARYDEMIQEARDNSDKWQRIATNRAIELARYVRGVEVEGSVINCGGLLAVEGVAKHIAEAYRTGQKVRVLVMPYD